MSKTFHGLSPAQLKVLGEILIGNTIGHNQRTVAALIRKGLVELGYESSISPDGLSGFIRVKYRVPTAVQEKVRLWLQEWLAAEFAGTTVAYRVQVVDGELCMTQTTTLRSQCESGVSDTIGAVVMVRVVR